MRRVKMRASGGSEEGAGLRSLWHFLLGPGCFERHPWIVAVALRCLDQSKLDAWGGDVKPYSASDGT